MKKRHQPAASFATLAVISALLAGSTVGLNAGDDTTFADTLFQRVVAQTTRSGLAIRAIRELHAGTVGGNHEGWMTIDTTLTPAGTFSWSVVSERGSERTRDKVFRAVLDSEAESWLDGSQTAAALTPANYVFSLISPTPRDEAQIRLQPRRRDSRLIDGILTVSSDGYPLRLDGKLAKSPSFWVKSVTVRKRYGRFAGVALPTVVETEADLKFVGKSRFIMRYRYREVNGRAIAPSSTTAALQP